MLTQINCNGILTDISTPKVMGILNITPDSFYDGNAYQNIQEIEKKINQYISEGASFIDIGAVSTRPGAITVSEEEEIQRLIPVLGICKKYMNSVIFSLDTYRSNIAEKAINDYGISIINDITSGSFDNEMFKIIKKYKVPYIIMHMQGSPQTMQKNPHYNNIVNDICTFFSEKIKSLNKSGIHDIIIDPGFGFGKTPEHNYSLLQNLDTFKILDHPILVGLSRKSMIYKLLEISAKEALTGTVIANTLAILKGANILRVHDVKETSELIKIYSELEGSAIGI